MTPEDQMIQKREQIREGLDDMARRLYEKRNTMDLQYEENNGHDFFRLRNDEEGCVTMIQIEVKDITPQMLMGCTYMFTDVI